MASGQDPSAGILGCLWMLPCPPLADLATDSACAFRGLEAHRGAAGPCLATARGAAAPTTRRLIGHVLAHELGEARDAEVDVAVVLSGVGQTLIDQSLTNRRYRS